jgi:hypothetical protein
MIAFSVFFAIFRKKYLQNHNIDPSWLELIILRSGINPTIVSYNGSAVKITTPVVA